MNIVRFSLKFPIAEVQPCTNQFPLCHLSQGQRVAFGGVELTQVTSANCQYWLVLYLMRLGPQTTWFVLLMSQKCQKCLIF